MLFIVIHNDNNNNNNNNNNNSNNDKKFSQFLMLNNKHKRRLWKHKGELSDISNGNCFSHTHQGCQVQKNLKGKIWP